MVTDTPYKIYILHRIHSKIWLATRKLNKHFGFLIILGISIVLVGVLDHGLLFASKLAVNSSHWTQIPITFTPIHIIILLGHACYRCSEIPKTLRSLLMKNLTRIEGLRLVESFSMQVDMQIIEFEPSKFFTFNFVFCLEVVQFIIDYDIVFMQFYFG